MAALLPDMGLIRMALACKCPRCGKGSLYGHRWALALAERCDGCGLEISQNDIGDGAAVFLIFLLGFLLVPLALLLEWAAAPPLWLHAVLWGGVALGLTVCALRPLKAYILALQFKHRPGDWLKDKTS